MAEIIAFDRFGQDPNLSDLGREQLLDCLQTVRLELARLDEREPEDMESEEFALWGRRHETLEDQADEIQDLLDGMGPLNG